VRVETGAHGGAARRQFVESLEHDVQSREVGVELGDVAGELLAEGERHGVHQVGATDL
jgi:hypothetical protein